MFDNVSDFWFGVGCATAACAVVVVAGCICLATVNQWALEGAAGLFYKTASDVIEKKDRDKSPAHRK